MEEQLFKLEIGESWMVVTTPLSGPERDFIVTRVPNGWIFESRSTDTATFVPLTTYYKSERIMAKDLFGNETIRTIGLYQPYASLMLHGKLESRWVIKGKKPPFPLGKYLIYSTKKRYSDKEFHHVAGRNYQSAMYILKDESTASLDGYALAIGDLVRVVHVTPMTENRAFIDTDLTPWQDQDPITIDGRCLWGLEFENVRRIKPFQFKGKQGVGFIRDTSKIEFV